MLNIFLTGIVITDKTAAVAAVRAMKNDLFEIMSQNGVRLSADADIESPSLPKYIMFRDLAEEKQTAEKVIGKSSAADLGGNVLYYSSDTGKATFRGTGEFDVSFEPGKFPIEDNAEQTAKNVLGKMGLTALDMLTESSREITTVTVFYAFNRIPVCNAGIVFTFSESSLIFISGQRPPGKPRIAEEPAFGAVTILMRFIDLINTEGYVCSEISSLTTCFTINDTAPGGVVLVPIWKIETDSGDYYINGLTGGPEAI